MAFLGLSPYKGSLTYTSSKECQRTSDYVSKAMVCGPLCSFPRAFGNVIFLKEGGRVRLVRQWWWRGSGGVCGVLFLRWLSQRPPGGRKAHCEPRSHTSRSGKDLPSVILRMCVNGVKCDIDSSWKERKYLQGFHTVPSFGRSLLCWYRNQRL